MQNLNEILFHKRYEERHLLLLNLLSYFWKHFEKNQK
jgi:hypothetical protein